MRLVFFFFILLFSTNSFAQTIVFDKCWDTEEFSNYNEHHKELPAWEKWFFEINLSNGTAIRTIVASDHHIKRMKDLNNHIIEKVYLDTFEIKSATKEYVQTFYMGDSLPVSYLFNLKKGELIANMKLDGKLTEPTHMKCEIYGSDSSESSGVKGFLKKLLGNN